MVKPLIAKMLLAAALLGWGQQSHAEVRLHSTLGSHMVLQQRSDALIRGTATPGAKVTVRSSWERGSRSVRAGADGRWRILLPTPGGSSEPQWIEVRERNTVRLDDVLIGEVWLCAGQSNMEMPMRGFPSQPVEGALAEILASPKQKQLRLFDVEHLCADSPAADCGGEWRRAEPESVASFSAVGYLFGRRLAETLGVPVGIVVASYGGSRIESWMDRASMAKFDPKDYIAVADKPYRDPCKLYNAMIAPLAGCAIRGVVWFQGESNRRNAHVYAPMLTEMMALWRREWADPQLPFIVCQIAPCPYHGEGELGAARLMEAQFQAVSADSAAYLVGTSDIGAEKFIHFPKKDVVAQRAFASALANVYGYGGIPVSGPTMAAVTYDGGTAVVRFDHADRGLVPTDGDIACFELAGADGVFHPAKARIGRKDRTTVEVSCDAVPHPCAVRYAFSNWHETNLSNCAGLPAYPFRTDTIRYE